MMNIGSLTLFYKIEWGPHENLFKFAQNIFMGKVDNGHATHFLPVNMHCSIGFLHSIFQHVFGRRQQLLKSSLFNGVEVSITLFPYSYTRWKRWEYSTSSKHICKDEIGSLKYACKQILPRYLPILSLIIDHKVTFFSFSLGCGKDFFWWTFG